MARRESRSGQTVSLPAHAPSLSLLLVVCCRLSARSACPSRYLRLLASTGAIDDDTLENNAGKLKNAGDEHRSTPSFLPLFRSD